MQGKPESSVGTKSKQSQGWLTAIFAGDTVLMEDDRFDYGEHRFVSLGLLQGRVIVVVHTEQGGVTRIISARKATKYEQRIYFQGITN